MSQICLTLAAQRGFGKMTNGSGSGGGVCLFSGSPLPSEDEMYFLIALPSAPLPHPTTSPLPRKLHGLIWQRQMKPDGNQHVKNKTKHRMKDDETSSCWSFLLLASVGSLGVFLHHSRQSSPLPAGRQAMISGPRSRACPNTSIS